MGDGGIRFGLASEGRGGVSTSPKESASNLPGRLATANHTSRPARWSRMTLSALLTDELRNIAGKPLATYHRRPCSIRSKPSRQAWMGTQFFAGRTWAPGLLPPPLPCRQRSLCVKCPCFSQVTLPRCAADSSSLPKVSGQKRLPPTSIFSDLSVLNTPRRFLCPPKTQNSPTNKKRRSKSCPRHLRGICPVSLKLRQQRRIPVNGKPIRKIAAARTRLFFCPDRDSLPKHGALPPLRPHRRLAPALTTSPATLVSLTT